MPYQSGDGRKNNSEKNLGKTFCKEKPGNNIDWSRMDDKGFETLVQEVCKLAKQDLVTELRAGSSGQMIQDFFHRIVPEVADEIIKRCFQESRREYKTYLQKKAERKEKERKVSEMLSKGYSQTYIYEQTGISKGTIKKIGIRDGYIVPTEGSKYKYYPRISEEVKEKTRKLLDQKFLEGKFIKDVDICNQVGISYPTLHRIKKEYGCVR